MTLLRGLKGSIMGYVPIFLQLHGLKSSRNSSRLKNRRCQLSLNPFTVMTKIFLTECSENI